MPWMKKGAWIVLNDPIIRFLGWLWAGLCWLDLVLSAMGGSNPSGLVLAGAAIITGFMVMTSKWYKKHFRAHDE